MIVQRTDHQFATREREYVQEDFARVKGEESVVQHLVSHLYGAPMSRVATCFDVSLCRFIPYSWHY